MNAAYIMASRKHGTLYIGVTSDLLNRTAQHREGAIDGFTSQYGVKRLVWYEWRESIEALIERDNPDWDDLYPRFFVEDGPRSHLQPREAPM